MSDNPEQSIHALVTTNGQLRQALSVFTDNEGLLRDAVPYPLGDRKGIWTGLNKARAALDHSSAISVAAAAVLSAATAFVDASTRFTSCSPSEYGDAWAKMDAATDVLHDKVATYRALLAGGAQ